MTENFFTEEAPRMSDWLSKAAEENQDFLEVKDDREVYTAPEYNREAQQQDHFKPERIHANINLSEEKNENLEEIFATIDKEAKRYMMYGFSINDIQTKLSSQYPKHVLSKYIKESLTDFNDHYGILGNICIDASLIGKENPYSVISKISSKNPTSILFVIDPVDNVKYGGIGLKAVPSVNDIKLSKDQAKKIIEKLGLSDYLSLVEINPVVAVKSAFKDFVENKNKIERVVGSDKRKQGNEHFSDHKTIKNDQIASDVKIFLNADKDVSCEEDMKFYTNKALDHIEAGTKYILKSSDIENEKEFKIGFDKLVSNIISEFQKRYGSKISYSNVVSVFRLDPEMRKSAYKGSDIGVCGIRFVSNKDNFKYASHNKELNKVFSGNDFNINDFGVDGATEITEKVFMPELDG